MNPSLDAPRLPKKELLLLLLLLLPAMAEAPLEPAKEDAADEELAALLAGCENGAGVVAGVMAAEPLGTFAVPPPPMFIV